jgi:hypothetical protein
VLHRELTAPPPRLPQHLRCHLHYWLITLCVMLVDDAAMLALMLS